MVIKLKVALVSLVRAVVRFFTPSVASITRDFERKIKALNKIVDQLNDDIRAEEPKRDALREQLSDSYVRESRLIDEACRVGAIRNNLENIIRA